MYINEFKPNSFIENYKDFKTIFGGGTTQREPVQKFNKKVNGTGTVVYNTTLERYDLNVVTTGDYAILQQSFNNPYFEGNKQVFDITSEYLHPQTNVIKYYGYFDMLSTGVDFTKIDGILLETDDTKVYLRTYNEGVLGFSQDVTSLTDWEKFSVFNYFFLWLGGASLEPTIFLPTVEVLELTKNTQVGLSGQFIKKPSKPITMAIQSTGGAGTCRYICSMVGTKQIASWSGISVPMYMTAITPTNNAGTYYHLKSVKINELYTRGGCAMIDTLNITTSGTNDIGVLLITKNATIVNIYADLPNSILQENTNNIGATILLANIGQVVNVMLATSSNAISKNMEFYAKMIPINIDGTNPTYSFIYLPQTATMNTSFSANFIEFR